MSREVKNDEKNGGVKNVIERFSVFPTTVLAVSGSKGMLSVLWLSQNTPIRNY
jgi:hypothetical protein